MKIKKMNLAPAQVFFLEIVLVQFIFTYYHMGMKKDFNIIDFLAGASICYIALANGPEENKGGPRKIE
jgi:hypothetical protein